MGNIQFGTGIRTVTDIAASARQIEKLGFDIVSAGEHVMFHTPIGNTYITLSVGAGRHVIEPRANPQIKRADALLRKYLQYCQVKDLRRKRALPTRHL